MPLAKGLLSPRTLQAQVQAFFAFLDLDQTLFNAPIAFAPLASLGVGAQ